MPYWSNPPFLIFDIWAPEQIKNSGLEPFEQQQFGKFGTAGVGGLTW